MFVRIVHHWCKPGAIETGREFTEKVGRTASEAPGFLYRYRLESREDPSLLTTLTVWRDRESFAAFQSGRPASNHADPANPFARLESQAFDVTGSTGLPDGFPEDAARAASSRNN